MLKQTILVYPLKARRNLKRVWRTLSFSVFCLRAGGGKTAFRQEAIVFVILMPAVFGLAVIGQINTTG